jgi:hypothetical protein
VHHQVWFIILLYIEAHIQANFGMRISVLISEQSPSVGGFLIQGGLGISVLFGVKLAIDQPRSSHFRLVSQ